MLNFLQPDGIFPLVLTSATQELFDCCADKDVTKKSPHKLLKKDDILQDIKTRAAESDFTPVKEIVLDYPEEEILLVFDADFTHGQNFYLVLAPEAKDILKPLDTTSDVFEAEVKKTPPPKQWISLGSEKEIEGPLKESRGKAMHNYKTHISTVNSNIKNAFILWSYNDNKKSCFLILYRNTQNNMDAQYNPREFSNEEKEKILQDESLKNILATQTPREKQSERTALLELEPALIIFWSFFDPYHPQLLLECPDEILAFEFCPSNPNIIAGGCVNGKVVLWDISAHVNYLQDLNDNKVNRTPVVPYCVESENKSSHRAPITDLQWLPPTFQVWKINTVTVKLQVFFYIFRFQSFNLIFLYSTLRFWDVRCKDLEPPETTYSIPGMFQHLTSSWKPFFTVLLPLGVNLKDIFLRDLFCDESHIVCCVFHHKKGEIVYTDWKMETKGSSRPNSKLFNILCLFFTRSPFFKDIILTTGGLNFAIWKEGVMKGPLVVSKKYEQECTAGCWSLSQPAVFFIGKEDGSVEEWDLLKKNSKPAQLIPHISKGKITCMKPWAVSVAQNPNTMQSSFTSSRNMQQVNDYDFVNHVVIHTMLCYLQIESMKKYIDRHTEYVESDEVLTKKTKEVEELKKKMVRSFSVLNQWFYLCGNLNTNIGVLSTYNTEACPFTLSCQKVMKLIFF
uniref:Dynein axonemal intermediate chain 3 n=1 Tax=Cyprinodon variegatus TaxID=28743 RepID=A0A3Q2CXE9_CYPVA